MVLPDDHAPENDANDVMTLRRAMSADVGVVRDAAGMTRALAVIADLDRKNRSPRFANMLAAAHMIAAGSLARIESRGGHYRSDYPHSDPAWRHRTYMTLSEAGEVLPARASRLAAAAASTSA